MTGFFTTPRTWLLAIMLVMLAVAAAIRLSCVIAVTRSDYDGHYYRYHYYEHSYFSGFGRAAD